MAGMQTAQVATALASTPVSSTFAAALVVADLQDAFNAAEGLTVFAPANSAFEKMNPKSLNRLIANTPAMTDVMQLHVVAGRVNPVDLPGELETLAGRSISVMRSGLNFTVRAGKMTARVVCGNVSTANATVYLIDTVLR